MKETSVVRLTSSAFAVVALVITTPFVRTLFINFVPLSMLILYCKIRAVMTQKSVAKNTAFMTVASVGQKVIAFVYFVIIARAVGVENLGFYTAALSFAAIFVVLVDIGFSNVLIRESSKKQEDTQRNLSTVLGAKIFFAVIAYFALVITSLIVGNEPVLKGLIYVAGITMIFDSLLLSLYGALRVFGDLRYEALASMASQFATLVLGGFFLLLKLPLVWLMVAFTVPSILNTSFAATVLYRKHKIKIVPKLDRKILKAFFYIAFPFALAAIFVRIYTHIDAILLLRLAGEAEAGLYSVAAKIVGAFLFIPGALIAALYPRFAEHFVHDKTRLAYLFEQSMKYVFLVALPIAVGIGVLAYQIVPLAFGAEYLSTVPALQILLAGMLFTFSAFPIGALLNACDRQKTQSVIVGVVMAVDVALNVILIPKYGIVGSALASLCGNVVMATLGYIVAPRIVQFSQWKVFKSLLQTFVAAGVMGFGVWFVRDSLPLVFSILVGAIVYVTALFFTRAITKEYIREGLALFKK